MTRRLAFLSLLATAGCYLSHQLHDVDGGPCALGRCVDAHVALDASMPHDASLRRDAGPVATCLRGETQLQACGHCGHATRTCDLANVWGPLGPCVEQMERCEVDLMLLADTTGSHTMIFRDSESALITDLVDPLERDSDVRVGVAAFADYGIIPYGLPDPNRDVPFVGVLPPTHDDMAVGAAISAITFYNGSDEPEAEIAGLDALSGGAPHPLSLPFTCAADEIAGGCWRPAPVWHVIVVMTDTASHNLPTGTLVESTLSPYRPFEWVYPGMPPAPEWTAVRAQLIRDGTVVYWIVPEGEDVSGTDGVYAVNQAREIALELGEQPDEVVFTYPYGRHDPTLAILAVRMAITSHFGITP